ncbi:DJ-1/PfpI family protein [Bdellovibrio sp. HCB2-146]|uniref:DJ-1/PfpI family protein n=1 Tax=Bdellovibrio sp. HCB2-146 TaxID=3394362 RepID=UPI0039BC2330
MKNAYVYLHNGFADWELGYVLPEIARPSLKMGGPDELKRNTFPVKTVSIGKQPVTSMGGLKVVPDFSLEEISSREAAILILPGGESWQNPQNNAGIAEKIQAFHEQKIPVAAICGAVISLARLGILNSIKHTGNNVEELKENAKDRYQGEALFQKQNAVIDQGIITAGGVHPVDFAVEVMKTLNLYDPPVIDGWYNVFKG